MSKEFYNEVYHVDHPSQYGGGQDGMPERSFQLINDTSAWLQSSGLSLRGDAKFWRLAVEWLLLQRCIQGGMVQSILGLQLIE